NRSRLPARTAAGCPAKPAKLVQYITSFLIAPPSFTASKLISIVASEIANPGRDVGTIVEAGGVLLKYRCHTELKAGMSLISARHTCALTTLRGQLAAAFRAGRSLRSIKYSVSNLI